MADPLTYVLDSIHLSAQVTCRLELSAPWGVSFPPFDGGFHVLYRGGCWVTVGENLVRLVPGDAEPWSVTSLAESVGLSRSVFAQRFSTLVGEPPHQYLTRWRMRLAAELLTSTRLGLSRISERVGYESGEHFNRAFKGHFGIAPGMYRKTHQPALPGELPVETAGTGASG